MRAEESSVLVERLETRPRVVSAGWVMTVALIALLWLMGEAVDAAEPRARLDRSVVQEGDTVMLTIESDVDDGAHANRPELGPLSSNFEVLGTTQGSEIRIVNGHRSQVMRWQVELDPRRLGELTVPSIRIGNASTHPLTLRVTPASTQAGNARTFIEIDADSDEAFVQSPVQVTVRLFSADRVLGGGISDPQVEDALVERVGEDRRYRTSRHGQMYDVVERRFLVHPTRTGKLRIAPVVFDGRVGSSDASRAAPGATPGRSVDSFESLLRGRGMLPGHLDDFFRDRDFFGGPSLRRGFNDARRIRVRSDALDLDVRDRPAEYSASHWLPAESVTLLESWSRDVDEARVGEPLARTITIVAKGSPADQLPVLEMPALDNARVYAERPTIEDAHDGESVFGRSEQSFSIVPTTVGALTLPEVRVAWWDVKAGVQRVATLPGRTVRVQPGALPSATPPSPATVPAESTSTSASSVDDVPSPGGVRSLPWVSIAALLAGVLVLTMGYLAFRFRSKPSGRPKAAPAERRDAAAIRAARAAFHEACIANDPRLAARRLLEWSAATWPSAPPQTLRALAAGLETGAEQVLVLEQVLYAPADTEASREWDGGSLWQALQHGLKARKRTPRPSTLLPPLHPHRA